VYYYSLELHSKKVLAMMGNEFCQWLSRVFLLTLLSLMGN
jgi:hypothetical protein